MNWLKNWVDGEWNLISELPRKITNKNTFAAMLLRIDDHEFRENILFCYILQKAE